MSFLFFVFFSLIFCFLSCLMFDPMKSAFFLVLSLVFFSPILSFFNYIWFSYFVCLIFLSGVFVIVVYFSSISNFFVFNYGYGYLFFLVSLVFFGGLIGGFFYNLISLSFFYYSIYFIFFFWILFCLLFFLNFLSYYLNFSGALRKL